MNNSSDQPEPKMPAAGEAPSLMPTLIPELDGIDPQYCAAFVRTVGADDAAKVSYQKQFFKYLNGERIDGSITIQPCLLNGKLAWSLYPSFNPKKRECRTACAEDVSRVPEKLLETLDTYKLLEKQMGSEPLREALKDTKANDFGGRVAEVLETFKRIFKKIAKLGTDYAKDQGLALTESLVDSHVDKVLKLKAGASVAKMCDSVIKLKTRFFYKQDLKRLKRCLIKFIQKKAKPIPGDPINTATDVNALLVNVGLAEAFIEQFPIGTARKYLGMTRVIWRKAKKNKNFRIKDDSLQDTGNPIIDTNPWDDIEMPSYEEYPTCILSPELTMAVLMDILKTGPYAFISTLGQFTFGWRSGETCWGLNYKHREHDRLLPITANDFTFKGGLYGLGWVTTPCHKTKDKEAVLRQVPLCRFAYSFWKPIIQGLLDRGLGDMPIFEGSHSQVTKIQNATYRRLGIFDLIAKRCKVPVKEVGKSCQANKSLGRHTFLTANYYYVINELSKPVTIVRIMAGHTERSHTLEKAYLKLSNVETSKKYLFKLKAPKGFTFDPIQAVTESKAKNRQNTRAGYQDWLATLPQEERDRRTALRIKGRQKFDTAPEFAPQREERKRKIGENTKNYWNSLSPEEQQRRIDKINEGQRRWRDKMAPEELEKLKQTRIQNMHRESHHLSDEKLKARGRKVWETRRKRLAALSPKEQAKKKEAQREVMRRAQAIRWQKRVS